MPVREICRGSQPISSRYSGLASFPGRESGNEATSLLGVVCPIFLYLPLHLLHRIYRSAFVHHAPGKGTLSSVAMIPCEVKIPLAARKQSILFFIPVEDGLLSIAAKGIFTSHGIIATLVRVYLYQVHDVQRLHDRYFSILWVSRTTCLCTLAMHTGAHKLLL